MWESVFEVRMIYCDSKINVVQSNSLCFQGGDEGVHGSAWGGVRLSIYVTVFGTPIESRTVHIFQDVYIFVKYFKS